MTYKGARSQAEKSSEEEFIEIWKLYGGNARQVADHIGTNERAVFARRKRLENKLGIQLKASRSAAVSYHNAFFKTNIEDGIVLVGTDPHYWPGEKTTVQRAFVHFIKEMKPRPKVIVLNGDVFDGSRISRFGRVVKKPHLREFVSYGLSVIMICALKRVSQAHLRSLRGLRALL